MLTVAATIVERLAQLFAVLLMLLAGFAAVARRVRQGRERRRLDAEKRVRPMLLDLIDSHAEGSPDAVPDLPAELGRYVDVLALNLAGKLRGSDRSVLVELLRRRGVVDRARHDLAAGSAVKRLRAVELLGSLALPETLDELTARLYDRNLDVRRAAVRAVGRIPTSGGARALLDLLDAPDRQVPEHCVTLALLRSGQPAVAPLVAALAPELSAQRSRAQLAAAHVLGWMGELAAVDPLLHLLDLLDQADPAGTTSLAATTSPAASTSPAGTSGSRDASEAKVRLDRRLAVIEALGRIGSPAAAGPLQNCLDPAQPALIRGAAAAALGRLGDPRSADILTGLLATEHPLALRAATALNQLGPAGRTRLTDHADDSPEARDVLRLAVAR